MAATLDFLFFDLPLKHPFTISRYTVNIQKTVVVKISDGVCTGYGEATVNPYYHSTTEKLSASLNRIKPLFERSGFLTPLQMWNEIAPELTDDYFALCAIDEAYWDFYAKTAGRTVRSFWTETTVAVPMTSYTIGLDSIEVMKQKIIEFPWPVYKIKLGRGNDIEIVKALRAVTDSLFRIDANAAWTADETIANSEVLRELNVEFIEQPLKAGDIDGMKKVYSGSALPVIADESCQREEDVDACAGLFHGINIKLTKCGGITPALRMIGNARRLGLKVMAGCMTESTVGISALVQLAPLLDFIDADGALLLAEDIASGASFDHGKIIFPEGTGTGVKMPSF